MNVKEIVLAGIAGTTAFTIFSYIISKATGENFKEPQLLGRMIEDVTPNADEPESQFSGWLLHYLIGVGFSTSYKMLLKLTPMKPTITNGAIVGAASAIPAVASWHSALSVHPTPPRDKTVDYFLQLSIGHIIFGMASFWVFKKFAESPTRMRKRSARNQPEQIIVSH